MTQFPSDQLAKQYLQGFLEPLGTVQRNYEISGEAKHVDIWFLPELTAVGTQDLGLLGRMAATPCLLEPFRNAPTRDEIESCLDKRRAVADEQRRRVKQEERKLTDAEQARLWILASTIYRPILEEYEGRLQPDWPKGVYFLSAPQRTALVAINQLPVNLDTLWLRLLGRGRTQQAAIAELIALPRDDTRRSQALQLLVSWRITLNPDDPLAGEEQELMATLSQAYLEWEQRTRAEGRQEEAAALILRQLSHKFGTLSAPLVARIEQISLEQLETLSVAWLSFQSLADLEAWLQNS